jgi:hypothetical protein
MEEAKGLQEEEEVAAARESDVVPVVVTQNLRPGEWRAGRLCERETSIVGSNGFEQERKRGGSRTRREVGGFVL